LGDLTRIPASGHFVNPFSGLLWCDALEVPVQSCDRAGHHNLRC